MSRGQKGPSGPGTDGRTMDPVPSDLSLGDKVWFHSSSIVWSGM